MITAIFNMHSHCWLLLLFLLFDSLMQCKLYRLLEPCLPLYIFLFVHVYSMLCYAYMNIALNLMLFMNSVNIWHTKLEGCHPLMGLWCIWFIHTIIKMEERQRKRCRFFAYWSLLFFIISWLIRNQNVNKKIASFRRCVIFTSHIWQTCCPYSLPFIYHSLK